MVMGLSMESDRQCYLLYICLSSTHCSSGASVNQRSRHVGQTPFYAAIDCKLHVFSDCTVTLPDLPGNSPKAFVLPNCVRTKVPRSRHLLRTPSP